MLSKTTGAANDAQRRTRAGVRPLTDLTEIDGSTAWAMVEASPDALVMVDDHGVIELVNRQTEVLFGYDRIELLGRPVELLLPDRLARAHTAHRTRFRAAPEVRAMGSAMDLLARRADGTEIPVEVSLSPMQLNGEMRVIAAVRDISDRVAAEAFDLEVRHGLDVVEDGVFMFAIDTLAFRYVNQGAIDQTGYSRAELLEMTPLHLKPEFTEASFRDLLAPVIADEVPSLHYTTVHRRKNGTDVPVEIVLQVPALERLSERRSCVALVRDIRERRAYEEAAAMVRRQASVLADRERIARDMHDKVIGRLFGAGMGIQATVARLTDPDAQSRLTEMVAEIDHAITEIRTTIYGVRSQIDWGEGIRGRVLAMAVNQNEVLGFEPEVDLGGPIDDLPNGIADELLATLREALTNTAKYAEAGNVTIGVQVTTRDVEMHITDDGVGFTHTTTGADDKSAFTGNGLANMVRRRRRPRRRCLRRVEPGTGHQNRLDCSVAVNPVTGSRSLGNQGGGVGSNSRSNSSDFALEVVADEFLENERVDVGDRPSVEAARQARQDDASAAIPVPSQPAKEVVGRPVSEESVGDDDLRFTRARHSQGVSSDADVTHHLDARGPGETIHQQPATRLVLVHHDNTDGPKNINVAHAAHDPILVVTGAAM